MPLSVIALMLATQSMEDLRRSHDDEVRAAIDERDWWLVSTVNHGEKQHRFYIDRDEMTTLQSVSRAWVDHYEAVTVRPRLQLAHDKFLMVARCDESSPQIMFKTIIHYSSSEAPSSNKKPSEWMDVVPESSQQTLWRFICHSEPANAIVYVPDGPKSDAQRYFARAAAK